MSAKGFTLLFLAALASHAAAQLEGGGAPAGVVANQVAGTFPWQRKVQLGQPMSLSVGYPAEVPVPITFTASDYSGPYDPSDPEGRDAARHRQFALEKKATLEVVKSYWPPGAIELFEKQFMKLVISEGKRFAFAHPKEATELLGIVNRVKALINTMVHRIAEIEKKNARAHAGL